MLKLKAYAKINLALEVMDVKDGYHEVNNIMIPISLYDELEFEKHDSICIENDIFKGNNIIEKVAKLFFSYTKINGGVKVKLNKNIPSEAGLAGGSSDGANTLKGLNILYDSKLSDEELIELSSKLGSDVGFFIKSTPAICKGRGEKVFSLESNLDSIKLLLIKPNTGLSTKLVYENYKYLGESKEVCISNIEKALKTNDFKLLKDNIFNDLAKTSLSLNKDMKYIYDTLKEKGIDVYVSGSGPTMYLLNPTEDEVSICKELFKNEILIECNTL